MLNSVVSQNMKIRPYCLKNDELQAQDLEELSRL